MRTIVDCLLALQKLVRQTGPLTRAQQARINELRKLVPPPVLTHFDRLVTRGRNGVALVRHGVCGECHIRVPVSTLASLVAPRDLYLCEICGCYLLLPFDEMPAAANPPRSRPQVRRTVPPTPKPAPAVFTYPADAAAAQSDAELAAAHA